MDCLTARATSATTPIHAIVARDYRTWLATQPKRVSSWLRGIGFDPKDGAVAQIPSAGGKPAAVVLGLGGGATMWSFAAAAEKLRKGRYKLVDLDEALGHGAALGWALAAYRFDRYKSKPRAKAPTLVCPNGCDLAAVERAATAIYFGRDLINTPAEDLGPAELAAAAKELAKRHGAKFSVITGKKLLDKGYPAIYTVGRAAASGREPRLIDLTWGKPSAPKVTLVGKGVVFDSGGLDLKPPEFMRQMKKDMGGAAGVSALAAMIMGAELPVRLRMLVPAVENAVSGNSYRPGDVVATRKGLSVEIGNTDAEGRMILCDALAEATAGKPDLIIDMATLTGAARVALGTEVPVLFATHDDVAAAILAAGEHDVEPDPLWRLPLYTPYRRLLDSKIADISNIGSSRYGGAITAALFLREFVGKSRWVHIDTMGFNDSAQAGRPAGGEVLAVRALYRMLAERY